MSLLQRTVLALLPHVPRPLVRRVASRYMAGEELGQAIDALRRLERAGHPGILDILGEDVTRVEQARAVAEDYARAGRALAAEGLDAYLSIKPTHLGLRISGELAAALYGELARLADRLGLFLRVEMEDHGTTDATLELYEGLRRAHANVGIVLQSRLRRTPRDIERLAPGPLDVRLCKGIYLEPASIAHTGVEAIREAYLEACEALWRRGARVRLATHDELLASRLIELAGRLEVPPARREFEVLLGVREELWSRWRAEGHTVRVYVPYGPEWLPYSLRRLRKNPQVLGHVLRALIPS